MKTTCWTLVNFILHLLILPISFAIFSIVTSQLVITNNDWQVCLLQSQQVLKNLSDPYKNNGNCIITQIFSFTSGIASFLVIFAFIIQILYKKSPKTNVLLVLSFLSCTFSFITLLILNVSFNQENLRKLGRDVDMIDSGRKLSGFNFGFWLISLIFFAVEHNYSSL